MRDRTPLLAIGSVVLLRAWLAWGSAADVEVLRFDAAYYLAVARSVADGQPVDVVLWHYLAPPQAIERALGEYWPPGWPYLLGGLLKLSGPALPRAVLACAALSLLLPLAVLWLARALGGSWRAAWLAGVLVSALGPLQVPSVTPDVTLPYQLLAVSSLAACVTLWRRARVTGWQLAAAGALAATPAWFRGEGFVVFLTAVALAAGASRARRGRRLGWTLLGVSLGLIPLLAYDLVSFGRLTPEARGLTPLLTHARDLYVFEGDPTFARWAASSPLARSIDAWGRGARGLFELPWLLVVLAAREAWCSRGRRGPGGHAWPLTLFVLLSWAAPALIAPEVFNPSRLAHNTAPVLCVLAALTLCDLRRLARAHPALPPALATCALVAATSWLLPLELKPPTDPRWGAELRWPPSYLREGGRPAGLSPADVVLTTDPWQLATLGVRTVQVPLDGARATDAVIARYRPTWFLVTADRAAHYLPQLRSEWQVVVSTPQGAWLRPRRGG